MNNDAIITITDAKVRQNWIILKKICDIFLLTLPYLTYIKKKQLAAPFPVQPIINYQRSTFNLQRSTFNLQRSTFNLQRITVSVQLQPVPYQPRCPRTS